MNRIYETRNGGQSWIEQRPDTAVWFSDILCLSPQEAIVVGSKGVVQKTENGGKRWLRVRTLVGGNLHRLEASSSRNVWATGAAGVLLQSSDAGRTWSQVPTGVSRTLFQIQFIDRLQGVILGDSATLLKTGDGGKTWRRFRIDRSEIRPSGMFFATAQDGWIMDGRIPSQPIETRDGGQHWGAAPKGLRPIGRISSRKGNVVLGIGMNGELLISTDRGNTWKSISSKFGSLGLLRSRNLCATLVFSRRYSLGLVLDAHTSPVGGSDHMSFIRRGYSAIDLSEGTAMEIWSGFDPFYHKPVDTSDKLDANLVRNATQLMVTIAAEAARPVARRGK